MKQRLGGADRERSEASGRQIAVGAVDAQISKEEKENIVAYSVLTTYLVRKNMLLSHFPAALLPLILGWSTDARISTISLVSVLWAYVIISRINIRRVEASPPAGAKMERLRKGLFFHLAFLGVIYDLIFYNLFLHGVENAMGYLLLLTALYTAGGLSSFQHLKGAAPTFATAAFVPQIVFYLSLGSGAGYVTAFLLAIFLTFTWALGLNVHKNAMRVLELNQELAVARQAADSANLAKSEFLANMSHELRTPLNAVMGFAEALQQGVYGEVNDRQRDRIGEIGRAGGHLLSLINDVLDLSKIEAGKFEPVFTEVDVNSVVSESLHLITRRAETAKVQLSTNIPENISPLNADERLLKQMLANLLSNAVKFTHAGGKVEVAVSQLPQGGVTFEVKDSGIGMAKEDIPVALSAFGQVDGSSELNPDGTGLGLPLVRSFMELHGGELLIDTEPGVGTTARLVFPDRNAHLSR